jgi:hypothetical protein
MRAVRLRSGVLLLLVVMALGLASCGKKGAPVPPGPPDQVRYPKTYPSR